MQKHEFLAVLGGVEVDIAHTRYLVGDRGELEIMRREQGKRAHPGGHVPGCGPRQRQAVERAGAAPDLIHQDQAALGRRIEDQCGLGHLDHESRAAAGQVIAGADTRMDAVNRPDDGPFSRHEGADSSQNHDQGGLAHVRRLAAHVGSRDHEHRRGLIKVHVVWHERAVEGLLDDEMAAADDLETALRDELWRHECQFACPLGEIGDDVDRGDGARGRLQRRKLCPGHGHQVVKEHLFPHEGAIPCSQYPVLECLELRCQETLGVFHGLAPHVVRRHGLGLASVELDVEAGHAVVGDLERVKAGALALRTLHLGEKGFRVGAEQTQFVELGIVARADHATIAHVKRRRVGQRPLKLGAQRAVLAKIVEQRHQKRRIGAGKGLPQRR